MDVRFPLAYPLVLSSLSVTCRFFHRYHIDCVLKQLRQKQHAVLVMLDSLMDKLPTENKSLIGYPNAMLR